MIRKSASLANGAVSYLEWDGAGPALHFAHANGFNAQTYRTLLEPLAGVAHIYASDLRGHGMTTLPAQAGMAKGWRIYRDDLMRLLEILPRRPLVLAGHSMGATASVMAAALRPDLVRGLVLIEPVFMPTLLALAGRASMAMGIVPRGYDLVEKAARRREFFPSIDAAFAAYSGRGIFKLWPDAQLRDYLEGGMLPTDDGQVRLACAPRWEAENFRETPLFVPHLARRIACPVTLLHGDQPGSTCRASQAAIFLRGKPDTRVVTVRGASHFLPMEIPDLVREEIARLMAVAG
ncbi:MAG: alpha/beta hydrolase [Rhizomicrobium sp.]|jgi:pimeloyl-ACP methyl ester carboxylesterase